MVTAPKERSLLFLMTSYANTLRGRMKMTEKEIFIDAIRAFGEKEQEEVAIEECSELIQAITHKHRGREHNIAEEIADVEIMLEQLKIINNCASEVEAIRKAKVERLYFKVYDACM
jgi:NTP pyrophosphatase (non-canonical NTP hydrolase)